MIVYIVVLLILYIRCFTLHHSADKRDRFYWIMPILLIGMAGLRYGPGSDFFGYLVNFEYSAGDVEYKSSFELGFRALIDVCHMGTKLIDNQISLNGGRVLFVVGTGDTLEDARQKVYQEVKKIDCKDLFYRTDIAKKVINS